jgi:hypothetical protein
LKIIVTVIKENNKAVTDISYKDKNNKPLIKDDEINKAMKGGGELILIGTADFSYQLKKNAGQAGLKLLTGEARSLTENAGFPFNDAGEFEENTLLKENLEDPVARLNNLIILFSEKSGLAIPPINVSEILQPFFAKQPNDPATKNDCAGCNVKYELEVRNKATVLYYDFSCKCFYKLTNNGTKKAINVSNLGLGGKKEIRLIIENVNRYIYDVSVTSKTVHYESEMPALFKNFFYGDSSKLLGSLITAGSQSLKGDLKGQFEAFKTRVTEYNKRINKLKARRLNAFLTCAKFNCCENASFVQEFQSLLDDLLDLRGEAIDLQLKLAAGDTKEVVVQGIEAIKRELNECQEKIKASNKLITDKQNEKDKLDPEKDKDKMEGLNKEIKKAEDNSCKNETDIKARLKDENERLVLIKTMENFQAGLPSEDDISKLFLFVSNMVETNSEYVQTPIPIQGNAVEFTIQAKPNDSSLLKKWNTSPLYNDSFVVEIPIFWKPFVSFSSGSYFSLGKKLFNKTYDWQVLPTANNTVSDSSKYKLTESGYTPPSFGFAALINIEVKASAMIGFGFSAGVGLTIEKKPRPSYLAGGSLFIGDRKQLVLTGGIAAMQMDRLRNNLQAAHDQQIVYSYKAPIEYYKEIKTGAFVSLTYTPFTTSTRSRSKSGK